MNSHVFISYAHTPRDREYVAKLSRFLATAGISAWFDEEFVAGDRWERVLRDKINSCRAFIVIMSSESSNSAWVTREVSHAEQVGKPILPILLDGQAFFRLSDYQYVDARDGSLPGESFLAVLREIASSGSESPSGGRISSAVRPRWRISKSTRRFVLVGIIGATLVAGISVPLMFKANTFLDATPRAATPADAAVTIGDIGQDSPDWIVPTVLEKLGTPPVYPVTPGEPNDHCTDWREWLDEQGAAPILGLSYVFVAAPAGAQVSITDARIRVTRKYAAPMTIVQCMSGAGGHQADAASVNLDTPSPDLLVQSRNGTVTVKAGRGQYVTRPGASDIVAITPTGTIGNMYEYQITLTYTVNAESISLAGPTLRFYAKPEMQVAPSAYDYDQTTHRWLGLKALSY